jgi:hypothetical protein
LQVLQKNTDKELHLFSDTKEHDKSVALLSMVSLSSQPVHSLAGTKLLLVPGYQTTANVKP